MLQGRRLDFVLLNHDEDLISAPMREQLISMLGTQRQQAALKDTSLAGETEFVLDVVEVLPKSQYATGKSAVLVTQDLRASATPK